ncbi:ABC transporter ATP-binding protein [candidate division WOR-3 bacterium]|nr:ABC transporter ATP-binding protein [candidate division WOR-3 bacterium]
MSEIIELKEVSKWYGKVLGVSDISIEIEEGVIGLLGPNGAGKSTFLKLVSGQIKPNIGEVKIFGSDVFSDDRVFRKIGFCPEYDSYFKNMSGFEFVFNLLRLHGFSVEDSRKKSEEALSRLGLLEVSSRMIKTYSMGMRQRIRIVQSFAHDPDLLLLDEPLNGVDPIWRIEVMKIIKEFSQRGKTVVVSSHVLPEIQMMTDEIILIHQGKVFAQGNIHDVRELIDSKPHIVRIKLKEPKKLARFLLEQDIVLGIDLAEEELTVKTRKRAVFTALLSGIITENNIDIDEIEAADDNLQSVFDYLVA